MMHIVIIGNGIAGVSCARYLRKLSDHRITIISGESPHFFSRTALMYVYMGHMKFEDTKPYEDHFWEKNRIELIQDWVTAIDFEKKQLTMQSKVDLTYDKLVIATGSTPRSLNLPGESLEGVQGFYSAQDLQNLINRTPKITSAAIVGGGLIGVELAEMLQSKKIHVNFFVRESSFWGHVMPSSESKMITAHIKAHGIHLHLSSELERIVGNDLGHVIGVNTIDGVEIPCQFVGLTVGVTPNITGISGSQLELDRGILVNEHFGSNIQDVYAIGDVAQMKHPPPGRKAIEQVWYTGKIHGITAAYHICGHEVTYNPGQWFNSAKFFDLEYQVYGEVSVEKKIDQDWLYWQHPTENKAVRLVWNRSSGSLLGMHSLGLRWRHPVFDQWLNSKAPIEKVIKSLAQASFDAEFTPSHYRDIQEAFTKNNTRI